MNRDAGVAPKVLLISPVEPGRSGRIGGTLGFIRTIREFMPSSWRLTTPERLLTGDPFAPRKASATNRRSRLPERLGVLLDTVLASRRIARMQPSVVYCHSPEIAGALVLGRKARRSYKVVLHQHGATNPIEMSRFPIARLSGAVAAYGAALRAVHRALDGIVVIDEACERLNVEWRVRAPRIRLMNAVHTERFKPDADAGRRVRSSLGLDNDCRVYLVAARLESVKRIDLAIRAMAIVVENTTGGAALVIAGEGGEQPALNRLANELGIADRVKFVGAIDWENMPAYLNACDACVLTSAREGIPMILLEGLSCGKPVVATRVGGIPEIVPEAAGILLDEDPTPSEVADALMLAARTSWSSDSLRRSVVRHGADTAVATLDSFFASLVSTSAPTGATHEEQ